MVGSGIRAAGDAYGVILRIVIGQIFCVFFAMKFRFRFVTKLRINLGERVMRGQIF